MLKEENTATRQGDSRCPGAEPSVAVMSHLHGHVPDLADENQTYPLPCGVFFLVLPLYQLRANDFPSVSANIVIAQQALQMSEDTGGMTVFPGLVSLC